MTTNYPERIDARLVRAGRVDLKVLFGFATREQISDLFIKMYDTSAPSTSLAIPGTQVSKREKKGGNEAEKEKSVGTSRVEEIEGHDPACKELVSKGKEFASLLPENELTPAEIQGFLLMRRDSSRRAIEEVEAWVVELRAEKEEARLAG